MQVAHTFQRTFHRLNARSLLLCFHILIEQELLLGGDLLLFLLLLLLECCGWVLAEASRRLFSHKFIAELWLLLLSRLMMIR